MTEGQVAFGRIAKARQTQVTAAVVNSVDTMEVLLVSETAIFNRSHNMKDFFNMACRYVPIHDDAIMARRTLSLFRYDASLSFASDAFFSLDVRTGLIFSRARDVVFSVYFGAVRPSAERVVATLKGRLISAQSEYVRRVRKSVEFGSDFELTAGPKLLCDKPVKGN